jgi:hypothetical protein
MKRKLWLVGFLVVLLWATPAKADNRIIVRTTLGLQGLQQICLLNTCTVVSTALDGTLGQVFLLTTTLDPAVLLPILQALPGIVDAEVDQLFNLVGGLNVVTTTPAGLTDTSPVTYFGATVWNGYANQPAASVVNLPVAQSSLTTTGRRPGSGIVADIDTGVDPNHPALTGVLLPGYDFTRSQMGGSEITDINPTDFSTYPPQSSCPTCQPAKVNQSSVAVLDQSSVAVLDGNAKYAAFGHGTMVMGVIHLVAPTAQLLPLKAFHSDGTGSLSDILRAIYYGVQNNANAINMSFDFKTPSAELAKALDYANKLGVICAASAGNDGQGPPNLVYPAALQSDVMGVASVGSTTLTMDTRSSFSNYGNGIVWVAAPGEAIVTTYPFNTYAAGWGTSFSAPFVSGTVALLRTLNSSINESVAATAVAHAVPLNASLGLGNGRLDVNAALQAVPASGGTADFSASAAPSNATITAGQQAYFTVSADPSSGFNQMVSWTCTGVPAAAMCIVSPSPVTLDGTNPATATVTLTTAARGMVTLLVLPRQGPPMAPWWPLAALFAWPAVLTVICNLGRASRWRPGLAAAAGVLAASLCTYACGGYGNPSPGSPTLSSVGLNPATVTGGSSSAGTVILSGPAPNYGSTVNLSSSASAATVPASVTVAAGASSANFTVNTSAVTASTPATITASYGGVMKTAPLTVNPPPGTPAGTYTLTITGTSGNLSHSTTVQVTVN